MSTFSDGSWNRRRPYSAHLWLAFLLSVLSCIAALAQTSSTREQVHDTSPVLDLDRSRRLLDTPRWKDAAVLVQRYLEQHPDSADAHSLLGLILYREREPRASMAEFLRASETADLTAFDLRIFALDCAAIPDLPEAEKWLLRSLQKNDHDAATWEALGHVRFGMQQYQGAIEALERALALVPHTVSAEALIGFSNERLARLDTAEAAYRQAIAWQAGRRNQDTVPLVGLGRVMLANDQAVAAIPWLRQSVAIPNAPAEAHELLGLAYSKAGRTAEAAAELETAVKLDPQSARLHLMLARVYRSLGAKQKADAEQAQYTKLKESGAQ